mgnify:CR=1 FL=1
MTRRRRHLTRDEIALWSHVTQDVRPRDHASRAALDSGSDHPGVTGSPQADGAPPQGGAKGGETQGPTRPSRSRKPQIAQGPVHVPPAERRLPSPVSERGHIIGLDRRTSARLRRGEIAPDRRLDLHGLRQEDAYAAFVTAVRTAHAQGLRCLLVITGKGERRTAPAFDLFDRPGILRESLPLWAARPELSATIAACVPASRRHGGAGAFYLYLRRKG